VSETALAGSRRRGPVRRIWAVAAGTGDIGSRTIVLGERTSLRSRKPKEGMLTGACERKARTGMFMRRRRFPIGAMNISYVKPDKRYRFGMMRLEMQTSTLP
jgi:hypothetical protein